MVFGKLEIKGENARTQDILFHKWGMSKRSAVSGESGHRAMVMDVKYWTGWKEAYGLCNVYVGIERSSW